MKVKEIKYLIPPRDIMNDCLDVFVTLENDDSYLIEVTTPKFFYTLMEKSKSDFLEPQYPYIIVSKLTDEIIKAAIQAYIDTEDDSFWLKFYHITATLNIEDINEILYRKEKENTELDAKIDAEIEAEDYPFLGKRKKFDLDFHHQLEQYFPDWKERMDYQKKQEEFYKSAMKRKREIKRLRLLDNKDWYSK